MNCQKLHSQRKYLFKEIKFCGVYVHTILVAYYIRWTYTVTRIANNDMAKETI